MFIREVLCQDATESDLNDIAYILEQSFEAENPLIAVKNYSNRLDRVLIAYEAHQPIAFLFYEFFNFEGNIVVHLGLTAKCTRSTGIQKELGMTIYRRHFSHPKYLFRKFVCVAVTNSPRSYDKMIELPARVEPDIYNQNEISDSYFRIAERLSLLTVNNKGIIARRMDDLGVHLKPDEIDLKRLDESGKQYMDYMEQDTNHGLLVMAFGRLGAIFTQVWKRKIGLSKTA